MRKDHNEILALAAVLGCIGAVAPPILAVPSAWVALLLLVTVVVLDCRGKGGN